MVAPGSAAGPDRDPAPGPVFLLQNGLLHHLQRAAPLEVVTAILFPPAPTPAPIPIEPRKATPTPLTPPRKPVERTLVKPAPGVKAAPAIPPPDIVTALTAPTPAIAATPAPAPAPVSTAQPTIPAAPRTITSGVQYLQSPQPDYPAQSKRLGEEGRVILRVLVDSQGHAERIDIQKSSGHVRLDEAAREAVRRALFKPQLEDGRPVPVVAIVPINFKLD